jgi:uncharacterized membrane protein
MSSTPSSHVVTGRLESIDILRGLVMVIMALDHARDFFSNLTFPPENLEKTYYALFFTRWITHFCAPLFFFLAGTGAFFYGQRRSIADLRRFLLSRGVWLIVLEFTIIGTAWTFLAPWGLFGVIWCLGISMLVLSQLVRLPVRWVAILSVAIIATHDVTDTLRPESLGSWGWLWSLLHVSGPLTIADRFHNFVLFPLVPWFAVMSGGFALGEVLRRERTARKRAIVLLGAGMTLAFVLLRITNLYGNPPDGAGVVSPGTWHLQATLEKTVILFLDTEKYPPSLQFLLMTLGPSLLLLAFLDSDRLRLIWKPLLTFGRVPMFFYILHLYVIHGLAVIVAFVFHQPVRWLFHGAIFGRIPPGYGYDLPFVYLMWAATIAVLYGPCVWFARLKQVRKDWWLSYL